MKNKKSNKSNSVRAISQTSSGSGKEDKMNLSWEYQEYSNMVDRIYEVTSERTDAIIHLKDCLITCQKAKKAILALEHENQALNLRGATFRYTITDYGTLEATSAEGPGIRSMKESGGLVDWLSSGLSAEIQMLEMAILHSKIEELIIQKNDFFCGKRDTLTMIEIIRETERSVDEVYPIMRRLEMIAQEKEAAMLKKRA